MSQLIGDQIINSISDYLPTKWNEKKTIEVSHNLIITVVYFQNDRQPNNSEYLEQKSIRFKNCGWKV